MHPSDLRKLQEDLMFIEASCQKAYDSLVKLNETIVNLNMAADKIAEMVGKEIMEYELNLANMAANEIKVVDLLETGDINEDKSDG